MNWYSPPAIVILVAGILIFGGVVCWLSIDIREAPVVKTAKKVPPKYVSFEQRAEAALLKEGAAKASALELAGREWATYSAEGAIEYHHRFKGSAPDRQAFDHGVMSILAKQMPEAVLGEVQHELWWPDQWKHEQESMTILLKRERLDLIREHIIATFDSRHQKNLGRWLGRQKTKSATFVETIWQRGGEKESPMLAEFLESWFNKSPIAGARWLNRQSGLLRETALPFLVTELAERNPPEALEWAITAAASEARHKQVASIVEKRALSPEETNAFKSCLQKSPIGQIEQERLLAAASRPQPAH